MNRDLFIVNIYFDVIMNKITKEADTVEKDMNKDIDYRKLYYSLFRDVGGIIVQLQEILAAAEERFLEMGD